MKPCQTSQTNISLSMRQITLFPNKVFILINFFQFVIWPFLYYACQACFMPSIKNQWGTTIKRLHFKELRLIVRDYQQWRSKETATCLTKRLPPDEWYKFAMISLFLNMFNSFRPQTLPESPGSLATCLDYGNSNTQIGRQEIRNWIGFEIVSIVHP